MVAIEVLLTVHVGAILPLSPPTPPTQVPPDLTWPNSSEAEKICVPPTTTVALAGVMASELAGE